MMEDVQPTGVTLGSPLSIVRPRASPTRRPGLFLRFNNYSSALYILGFSTRSHRRPPPIPVVTGYTGAVRSRTRDIGFDVPWGLRPPFASATLPLHTPGRPPIDIQDITVRFTARIYVNLLIALLTGWRSPGTIGCCHPGN